MREKLVLRLGGQQMKTKTLWGIIWILLILWAGTVLAQSENEAINLAKEAKTILDSAKSKEDYQRAAQKYEEALKISERVKSDKLTALCSNGLGVIQYRLGHYQKSLMYYEKSLAITQKIGDVKGEGSNLRVILFWPFHALISSS
jgi:tetratricopeptide (TPR) repeat protein